MSIKRIDHVAITVADLETSCAFYERLFGLVTLMNHAPEGRPLVRQVLVGGGAMLSVHQLGNGINLVADRPTVGAIDICFEWDGPIESAVALLDREAVAIIGGPVGRSFSDGRPSQSVYFRDPDDNLLELMAAD
jgi:catechol 2,3-dioxygenase-like lactoylglutathione lyase family enzyme